jgi:hypothetical protein
MVGAFVEEVDRGEMRDIEGFSNKAKELCCVKGTPAFGVDDSRRVWHADNFFMTLGLYIIRLGCFPHSRGQPHHFTT